MRDKEEPEEFPDFPEDSYHGVDIIELAQEIIERDGDKYLALPEEERKNAFIAYGLPKNIDLMHKHLERYGIRFDEWFPESRLHAAAPAGYHGTGEYRARFPVCGAHAPVGFLRRAGAALRLYPRL